MKASNNTCYQTSYRYFHTLKKVKSLKISIRKYFLEIGYSGKLLEFQWIWDLHHLLLTYFYVAVKVYGFVSQGNWTKDKPRDLSILLSLWMTLNAINDGGS